MRNQKISSFLLQVKTNRQLPVYLLLSFFSQCSASPSMHWHLNSSTFQSLVRNYCDQLGKSSSKISLYLHVNIVEAYLFLMHFSWDIIIPLKLQLQPLPTPWNEQTISKMPSHSFSYFSSSELELFKKKSVDNFSELFQSITKCSQVEHFLLVYQLQTENKAESGLYQISQFLSSIYLFIFSLRIKIQ